KRIRGAKTPAPAMPLVWHPAYHSQLEEAVPLAAWAHKRLLRRLSPGPAIFVLPLGADELRRLAERFGAPALSGLAVRISAHPACRMLAEAADGPVFVEEIEGPDGWATTAESAGAAAEAAGL